MTWTYSGDPSTSNKDEVRFLIGDTDELMPQISDEEIAYVIGVHADPGTAYSNYRAAAVLAESIAAKYAKKADKTVDGLSINYTQKYEQYLKLAERLRDAAVNGPVGVKAVGPPVLGGGGVTYLGNDFE